jgi:endonuclease/exonuclease/phosphatase family metal-dependent hydrolase
MHQEIRFASFNAFNLALPGMVTYDNLPPYTEAEYAAKIAWTAQQLDKMDADVIGFQEIFSPEALRAVLAQSRNYRDAELACFAPHAQVLTPSVALVSRLPMVGGALGVREYIAFPPSLTAQLARGVASANAAPPVSGFARPILHAQIALTAALIVNVFVVHLKSKRPDFHPGEQEDDPYHVGLANLRSAIQRDTEALGLRYLLTDLSWGKRVPMVVMGDFNDVIDAVSTQIVMGAGRHDKADFNNQLFDCYHIQSKNDPSRDVGYSTLHDNRYQTIDHILVSEEFNAASDFALGKVIGVRYLNDHLADKPAHASDHGQVVARIKLYG